MAIAGVYQILNRLNGKRYVGSSVAAKARMKEHRRALKDGCHCNKFLQN